VIVPTGHVEALDELTTAEAETLGRLLRDSSVALKSVTLKSVTQCRKTYVLHFAEADGLAHLHPHVLPCSPDLPDNKRGPRVFGYMQRETRAEEERDNLALQLRAAWPRP
jgi:diadenosine tetraphosphate (Ap4A) HIT family hydrolase